MGDNIYNWICCPKCSYDKFDSSNISGNTVKCPECSAEVNVGIIKSEQFVDKSELADVCGISEDRFEDSFGDIFDEDNKEPNDAEEVDSETIEFIREESYYKSGGEVYKCPECGEKCDMSCGDGYYDVAYCENCDYEYTRSRDHLVDHIEKGMVLETRRENREPYEEYKCEYCNKSHPYTRPNSEYTRPKGEIQSHERVVIKCPCGDRVHINNIEVGSTVVCVSCEREYTIDNSSG